MWGALQRGSGTSRLPAGPCKMAWNLEQSVGPRIRRAVYRGRNSGAAARGVRPAAPAAGSRCSGWARSADQPTYTRITAGTTCAHDASSGSGEGWEPAGALGCRGRRRALSSGPGSPGGGSPAADSPAAGVGARVRPRSSSGPVPSAAPAAGCRHVPAQESVRLRGEGQWAWRAARRRPAASPPGE